MSEPIERPPLQDVLLEQIASIASEEHESLTGKQAAAIIAAYHNVMDGDPVGTMRRDPETGAVALKVAASDGLLMWRVNVPDGSQYSDLAPTLPWPVLEV